MSAHFGNAETGEETGIEEGDRENDTSGNGWRLRVASYVFKSDEFDPLEYARIMWTLDAGRLQEIAHEHSEWHAARQAARDWLFVEIREKERAAAQADDEYGREEDTNEQARGLKTFSQFKAEHVAAEYLLDGLMQAARLYTLTGNTGAGKTLLLILIALALATGRKDILDVEVERTRVVYASYENPEDFRAKLMAAAEAYGIADRDLDGWLYIEDANPTPERIAKRVDKAKAGALIIDTMQAAYHARGKSDRSGGSNDNDEMLAFVRRYRPTVENAHRTTVLIAAHPVKRAQKDNLLPYGAGSVVNEIDGNFSLWADERESVTVSTWHWQGKFRGVHFKSRMLKIENRPFASIPDHKGRPMMLPVMSRLDADEADKLKKQQADGDASKRTALLVELNRNPGASIERLRLAAGIGSKSTVSEWLNAFAAEGLAARGDDKKWLLTDDGQAKVAGMTTKLEYACLDDDEAA